MLYYVKLSGLCMIFGGWFICLGQTVSNYEGQSCIKQSLLIFRTLASRPVSVMCTLLASDGFTLYQNSPEVYWLGQAWTCAALYPKMEASSFPVIYYCHVWIMLDHTVTFMTRFGYRNTPKAGVQGLRFHFPGREMPKAESLSAQVVETILGVFF